MNYTQFMSAIPLREDILDDVTYLQKHLRLLIKFHQVSGKLTRKPAILFWKRLVGGECLADFCSNIAFDVSRKPTNCLIMNIYGVTFHDIDLLLLLFIIVAEIILETLYKC
jgi:hypothetical protein